MTHKVASKYHRMHCNHGFPSWTSDTESGFSSLTPANWATNKNLNDVPGHITKAQRSDNPRGDTEMGYPCANNESTKCMKYTRLLGYLDRTHAIALMGMAAF